jgi:hypothetical protein
MEKRCIQGFSEKPDERGDHLEDLGIDGRIISNSNFKNWNGA